VSAASSLLRRALSRLPDPTARQRLTLLYAGMFVLLGSVVIVLIYLFTSGSSSVSISAVPGVRVPGALHDVVSQQHSVDNKRLLAVSWVALMLAGLGSTLLGWLLAGRVLRPLRHMADTARTISAGTLSERLALQGPNDEFKQLGDTLDDLLARLEASFEAQRRFVANASHELRTPLTVERTLLQVALADPGVSVATLRAVCEELLASGRDQEQLLEALLTLTSSERGIDRTDPLDLSELTGRVLAARRSEMAGRSLSVAATLRPAPVSGDGALLERLAANLVDNAVHYNHDGGEIALATDAGPDGSWLSIENTGAAVPASEVARLFEPFQRVGGRTAAGGHHGLGLSIVRAIAAAHHATIEATPGPAGGLRITIHFPSGQGRR
jgi:signal transduction histidine kinase